MHCSVVSRAKKSPLPSISDVTHGEHDFDTQVLLVFVYDTLGPPSFQRSPRIPSLEVLGISLCGLHFLDLWHL